MSPASLAGFTVGVTADRRAEEQVALLRRRGAEVVTGPSIRTHPLTPEDGLGRATEAIIAAPLDVVVLTTGIGVRSWLAAAESLGLGQALLAALGGAYVVARGPKAVGAAVTAGLPVAWTAPSEQSEEILAHLGERPLVGRRVAVQLDGRRTSPVGDALRREGARVVDVPVYRWTQPEHQGPARRLVDAAIAGREVAAEPRRARLGAMVEVLAQVLSSRRRTVVVGSLEVILQGRLVLVGELAVALAHQERAVLEALARRPGELVAKARLGRLAWGTSPPGLHTVEVTVARLRRRLAPVGLDVESVARRGYRLAARGRPGRDSTGTSRAG